MNAAAVVFIFVMAAVACIASAAVSFMGEACHAGASAAEAGRVLNGSALASATLSSEAPMQLAPHTCRFGRRCRRIGRVRCRQHRHRRFCRPRLRQAAARRRRIRSRSARHRVAQPLLVDEETDRTKELHRNRGGKNTAVRSQSLTYIAPRACTPSVGCTFLRDTSCSHTEHRSWPRLIVAFTTVTDTAYIVFALAHSLPLRSLTLDTALSRYTSHTHYTHATHAHHTCITHTPLAHHTPYTSTPHTDYHRLDCNYAQCHDAPIRRINRINSYRIVIIHHPRSAWRRLSCCLLAAATSHRKLRGITITKPPSLHGDWGGRQSDVLSIKPPSRRLGGGISRMS